MAEIHWKTAANGNFGQAGDWRGGAVPGPSDDAIIDAAGADFTVLSGHSHTVASLQTAANATLAVTAGAFSAIHGTGAGSNDGTISVGAGASFVAGGAIANSGTIATTGTGTVSLLGASVANTGLVSAGDLLLVDSFIDDTHGGVIAPVARMVLTNGDVLGGALTVSAGGTLTANGYADALATATLTNAGAIDVRSILEVRGLIVNSGGIKLAGATDRDAYLKLDGQGGVTTLSGGGAITLSDSSHNYVYGAADPLNLFNLDNTISGAGTIGETDAHITNAAAGVIDATGTRALILQGGREGVLNFGLIEATGQGGLYLGANVFNQGTLDAAGSGALTIAAQVVTNVNHGLIETSATGGIVLDGGSINNTAQGGGVIAPLSHLTMDSGTILSASLMIAVGGQLTAMHRFNRLVTSTLTNGGEIAIGAGAELQVQGAIVNKGGIQLTGGAAGAANLFLGAATTLEGGGAVTLGDSKANAIQASVPFKTVRLTNVDNTISGAGTVGGAGFTLVNEAAGIIEAVGATALVIAAEAVTDAGLMEAVGAGGLRIQGAVTGGGSLSAASGSTLEVDSSVAAAQSMRFVGGNAVLALGDPSAFAATISGFAPTDSIDLLGFKATAATLNAADQLVITNGATTVATLQLAGNYTGDTFTATFGGGVTKITVSAGAGSARPPPRAFVSAMAGMGERGAMAGALLGHAASEAAPRLASPRAQVA